VSSIIRVTFKDYGETRDETFEFFGPFRDDAKARDVADKINVRLDRLQSDPAHLSHGHVYAEAVPLRAPRINAVAAEVREWLKDLE
jgi:hypothetical protein